jgi:ribonuclease HIII
MTTYTDVKKEDLDFLKFTSVDVKSEYEVVRLRGMNCVVVLFSSGKLLLQGKEENVKKVEGLLDAKQVGKKVKALKFAVEKGVVIGTDEALKGDTFGGIVVAGVKAGNLSRKDLLFAGVMDSKKLSDKEVFVVEESVKKVVKFEVISLMPLEYNNYENQTRMLNELHAKVVGKLGKSDNVFIDKYPGCRVEGARCETKAESKYVEVAAASILARAEGLRQLEKVSKVAGFSLPKGSTHVKEALEKCVKIGVDLRKVAKTSFKNVQKFL